MAKKVAPKARPRVRRTPDDAAAQLRRLLITLAALADDSPHRIRDLATMVGVDEKTLASDLRTLVTRSGYEPAGFAETIRLSFESERVQMFAPVLRRPMALTSAEVGALELGLATLRLELPPHEAAIAESARARIVKAATLLDRHQRGLETHAVRGTASDVERTHLSVLREAFKSQRKVRLQYRTGGALQANTRSVHPYGLINFRGTWYLLAHCEIANSIRIFRVDRMAGVTVLEEPATVPSNLDLKATLTDGQAMVGRAADVVRVRYSKDVARWIREDYQVKEQKDGSVVVDHPLLDDGWAVRHVLHYGPTAEVLSPPRIRALIADRLAAILSTSLAGA
jgi:proteasome accessory factor C